MTQGIYKIVNQQDGKASTYVGSSTNIEKRWKQHLSNLRTKQHRNAHLQYAWNKWGETAFAFSVLEEVDTNTLLVTEQKYLDDCFDRGHCYNIATTAGPAGPLSEEHKRRISEANMGHEISEETRRKIGEGNKGKVISEETRHKLSRTHRGKRFSKEHRRKLSEAAKGRKFSEESKQKMSRSNMGKKFSEGTRCKMSNAHRGKKLSKETKRKMSNARKLWWARKKAQG